MDFASLAFIAVLVAVAAVVVYDLFQKRHAILRNFPIVGHIRFMLEAIGPELRQYIVTSNNEERPFSRDERRWVYATSKKENSLFGFGTDDDLESSPGRGIFKQSTFPLKRTPEAGVPCAKILGGAHERAKAFRPTSVVNISGMSYGSLSSSALQAMNRGASLANCWHNTGEGGVSPAHLEGGPLVFQVGTSYFGCRDAHGRFELSRLQDLVERYPIQAIEIKLSQGAKPGAGGFLPAAKVSKEVASIRGIPVHTDCASPPYHTAFTDAPSLVEFVEEVADSTGLPVGIKSAVGDLSFWNELAALMARDNAGPDFVTIDGGEGGTGAAPLFLADHVSLPFKMGFPRVYREFARAGIGQDIVFQGSGRLGFPDAALFAMAMGCDLVAVGREVMLSIGCIQALRCHTGKCPTGVATQSAWLARGLDPALKSTRAANYISQLRSDILVLAQICGYAHPSLVPLHSVEILGENLDSVSARDFFHYEPSWGLPSPADIQATLDLMD